MANQFDAMRAAVDEAEQTMRAADSVATRMASMLRGRLRKVNNSHILKALKAELSAFDARTGKWSH